MRNKNAWTAALLLGACDLLVFKFSLSRMTASGSVLFLVPLHYVGLVAVSMLIERIKPTKRSKYSLSFVYNLASVGSLTLVLCVVWWIGDIGPWHVLTVAAMISLMSLLHYRFWVSKSVKGVNPDRLFQ